MPKGEHLLPGKYYPHRAFKFQGRHHSQKGLVLRAQARTKCATNIRTKHPDIVFVQIKNTHEVLLAVRSSLRFVIYRKFIAFLPDSSSSMHFQWVVMFAAM